MKKKTLEMDGTYAVKTCHGHKQNKLSRMEPPREGGNREDLTKSLEAGIKKKLLTTLGDR